MLVEGRVAIANVLASGAAIDRLLVTPRAEPAIELQRRAVASGARKLIVSDHLMGALCDTATPPSMLAVVPTPSRSVPPVGDRWCGLLISEQHDPRALGAMLLAAAACGVDACATTERCADPWSPKVVRASAAAGWQLPILRGIDARTWIAEMEAQGVTVAGLGEGLPVPALLSSRFLLVTGPHVDRLDLQMRLETTGTAPALPVSISVSHVLADWSRQHR